MTTFLKFLLGNNEVRIRRNSFKNSFTKKNNNRRKFVYNTSHSFSVRTNKDKIQSCGELYMGDVCTNESLISQDGSTSLFCTDNTRIEGLTMKNDFESEHCPLTDEEFQKNIDRNTEEMVFIDEEIHLKLRK